MKSCIQLVRNNCYLLKELVIRGIRLKYRRSYLGIVWSLIEPIMTTVVLVIIFGTLLRNEKPDYPVYVIIGRLFYSYFSTTTSATCKSIRQNAIIIKKVYVPKMFYPVSTVMFYYIIFLISMLSLVPVCLYCHISFTYRLWHMIPALGYAFILTLGVGLVLTTMNVYFRDIEYLWNIALLLIMYASAIFYYPGAIIKSKWFWILKYNPLFCIIELARSGLLNEPGKWWDFFYPMAFGFTLLAAGSTLFIKKQDEFILYI